MNRQSRNVLFEGACMRTSHYVKIIQVIMLMPRPHTWHLIQPPYRPHSRMQLSLT